MQGIYVHVPFCVRKCSYCDFYSVMASEAATKEFCDLIVAEMDLFRQKFPEDAAAAADTVYFGGGTPTVLAPEALCGLLDAIRDRFPVEAGAEITAEANPGTVAEEEFRALKEGGFTRMSIGVQSFTPATLRTLGRIHGVEDIHKTYRDGRSAGFDDLGIDLIFGIPGQETKGWEADLERAVTLGPSHVSVYALAPEPGTPIHAAIERGELRSPSDEEMAKMYRTARRIMENAGYRHYEISNFARPGRESRHNRKYWKREGYAGFGPSAHGLLFPGEEARLGMRTANPPSLAEYGNRIREGRLPWEYTRVSTVEDAWKESLIFGLRMTDGVDPSEIEERIGAPPEPLRGVMSELAGAGKLLKEGERLRLPAELFFVSNEVLQSLA